ncbi:MAG: nucleotide exchange factor GrpE [Bdellovibrionales bacterium]
MNDESEEEILQESLRREAEALARRRAQKTEQDQPELAQEEQDHLAPEPAHQSAEDENVAELYPEHDELGAGTDDNPDGHTVILKLQEELENAKDQMIRAVAETDNIRRRSIKEREDASKYAVSGFAKDLLSVADNLRRALDAVPQELAENEKLAGLIGGIEATERELLKAFELNGIKKLETQDGVFDPNHHEVMFETPGTGKPAGTIIQTLEPGYTLHDRLIRPARVGVAKDEGEVPPPVEGIDTQA